MPAAPAEHAGPDVGRDCPDTHDGGHRRDEQEQKRVNSDAQTETERHLQSGDAECSPEGATAVGCTLERDTGHSVAGYVSGVYEQTELPAAGGGVETVTATDSETGAREPPVSPRPPVRSRGRPFGSGGRLRRCA